MKILIVEDNALIANNLIQIIASFGYNSVTAVYNQSDAMDILQSQMFDLALLDIRLHENYEGIEVAQKIYETNKIPFVYISAFSDLLTMNEALKYKPVGYITKPFRESDIYSVLKIAENSINEQKKKFYKISTKDSVAVIEFEEIIYLKADNVYIEIHTTDKKHIVRATLGEIITDFPPNFIRTHRSFVVNIKYFKQFQNNELIHNAIKVPVSSTYKQQILEFL